MFIDKAEIYVKAGNGGNGMLLQKEKFEPSGGPAGVMEAILFSK